MTTLNSLVDDVQLDLSGFTYRQDRVTYLLTAATTSDLVLNVASTENIGKSIIEIDDEMMWVDSYDRQANTVTIAPFGRGYNGTTATAHAVNAKVVITPTYPRSAVKRAINDTLNAVYPKVFSVGSTAVSFLASRTTYSVPATAIQISSNCTFAFSVPGKPPPISIKVILISNVFASSNIFLQSNNAVL